MRTFGVGVVYNSEMKKRSYPLRNSPQRRHVPICKGAAGADKRKRTACDAVRFFVCFQLSHFVPHSGQVMRDMGRLLSIFWWFSLFLFIVIHRISQMVETFKGCYHLLNLVPSSDQIRFPRIRQVA